MNPPESEQVPILDIDEALVFCDNDREILREMINSFQQSYPEFVADMRAALETGDARLLEQRAHKLKGRAATLGAGETARAALQLETIGRGGDLSAAPAALQTLVEALARLQPRLAQEGEGG